MTCLTDFISGAPPSASSVTSLGIPCRETEADLWFAEAPAELEAAKALCQTCPLQRECLTSAIERSEPWGVWGGEIFERGQIVARKRPRGRPRKIAS
ncbi:MAG: WhiB family transcriptional regulator [Gordonia sp. (in: high G+C Gram-positive bacteria)]|uniref:WhiB family transcriptional regulator n=1 Tax=Gordonia sp. (in: high G+C Gram-positive bacteria) TaxID=84139 RepID=UPI0039E31C9E